MRREDLGGRPAERAPSLDEALRVPDLDDVDVVRTLWDDLAGKGQTPVAEPAAPVVEPTVPVVVPPAPEPVVAEPSDPAPPTRRQRRRDEREQRARRREAKLQHRRHRILPRTVIGIATMLLAFAIGVGVSGAVLYAYYDWRLSQNEDRVGELSASLQHRLEDANEQLQRAQAAAVDAIREESRPLQALLEDTAAVSELTGRLDGKVWFVSTLDENGQASVGSGFIAASDESQSLLVTSYSAVAAATTEPAPTITVSADGEELTADLYNWDVDRDLALLIVPRGGLEPLQWADQEEGASLVGQRVFVASGLGANGVALSPGLVVDQSAAGLQHTAAVGQAFRGGPVVDGHGRVVAIASLVYAPLNFAPGDVPFAVPVQQACERVLTCDGDVPS